MPLHIPASQAIAIMDTWENLDAIDNLLRRISKSYTRKAPSVAQWATDLAEERVWRGGNSRVRTRVCKKKPAASRGRRRTKSTSGTPLPVKVWTKDQREEATKRKSEEADEAALRGVRRSRRARVPSEKVLNAE